MHADELYTDADLVRRLLAAQFPDWAELPIERVTSCGTDNALYRLGEGLVARLPLLEGAGDLGKDAQWLPRLAPLLPVAIPELLATGAAAEGYPCAWGVYRWLEGENPVIGAIAEPELLARDTARFVDAVRGLDLSGGPRGSRAGPLAPRDGAVRRAIREVAALFDTEAVTAAWQEALEAPPWPGPPVWTHGDLLRGNLLLGGDRLIGVIDWSLVGVGDPACDLLVAWSVLPAELRGWFRSEVGIDDATWTRGRGWALCVGLLQVPYYKDTNPELAANGEHMIREVLAESNIRS
jgi:aminoglycoside phosphotransferase (APT) family kinase protein